MIIVDMADEVRANTDDLGQFVDNGQRYLANLSDISETLQSRRATVAAELGFDTGWSAARPFEELLAEVSVNNRFVDTIRVALNVYQFEGSAKTVPTDRVTAALDAAGLNLGGEDLSLAEDQLLANAAPVGPVGDDALALLAGWMRSEGISFLSNDELLGLRLRGTLNGGAGRVDVPRDVLQAVSYLHRNPELAAEVSRMTGRQGAFTSGVSVGDLRKMIAVNRGVRVLADRETFRAVDADGDGRISFGEISQAQGVVSPEVFAALQTLTDLGRDALRTLNNNNVPFIELAGEAERRRVGDDDLSHSFEDRLSYIDIVGAAINRHAFVNNPDAAFRFVTQLPTAFDDLSGKGSGFDIRLVNDRALRALANASLAGADGLLEQTLVVAHLPESEGAVRNLLITAYYAEVGQRMNARLNSGLADPLDPSQAGHSGANWLIFAPNASNGVRPVITADLTAFGFAPSQGDRQAAADGNQYIFGTLTVPAAAFLDAFPEGQPITPGRVDAFFDEEVPGERQRRVFRSGQADLRDGFAYYAAALVESDPVRRQELAFTGNLLLATSEQGGAQNWIEQITDLDRKDDGWRFLAQPFTGLVGGDEVIATDQMRLPVGIPTGETGDDAEEFAMARDIPNRPGVNNQLLGVPIADFDPTDPDAQVLDFGTFTVGLDGVRGDVTTDRLGGWDNPPAGSNMEALPTSVAHWAEQGDTAHLVGFGGVISEVEGSDDGIDLRGTGAIRWSNWEDRQWYIANLFHQFHTDQSLFDNLTDFEPDRTDISSEEAIPNFVPMNALFELGGGGR